MITRIYIDNFRCFSNFELRPGRINLLIGSNGSGKSTFQDALARIRALVLDGREIEELFSEADLTQWDSRTSLRFELDFGTDPSPFRYLLQLGLRPDGYLQIVEERVTHAEDVLFSYHDGQVHLHRNDGSAGPSFPFRGSRSFLAGIEERPETSLLMAFFEQLRGTKGFKLEPSRIDGVSRDESRSLAKDGSNFASWYRHFSLERAADVPDLFGLLADAVPGFRALALKGAGQPGNVRELVVQMQTEEATRYEVAFGSVSDGQRALILLYTLLFDLEHGTSTLFLDEPENYVGLAELQPWLQLLDEHLGDKGQLFLISHHPEVIDFLAPEHTILFERPAAGPVRAGKAEFDREQGLKASEQIARGYFDDR